MSSERNVRQEKKEPWEDVGTEVCLAYINLAAEERRCWSTFLIITGRYCIFVSSVTKPTKYKQTGTETVILIKHDIKRLIIINAK